MKQDAQSDSKVGRPTTYKPKYCKMLLDHFAVDPYSERTKKVVTKNGVVEISVDEANDFPTLAGFAIKIGVHRETLLNWTKEHPEFFDAYKMAKEYQENFLAINGNKGLINPAFGIFTAKNVIDWRDKKDVEHSGEIKSGPEKLSDEELQARIDGLLQKRDSK